jgi:molybdopterin biosynthesis enzyme MoaB
LHDSQDNPVNPENLVNPVKQVSGIKAVVITVSDACSRGEREDTSGKTLVQLLTDIGANMV